MRICCLGEALESISPPRYGVRDTPYSFLPCLRILRLYVTILTPNSFAYFLYT